MKKDLILDDTARCENKKCSQRMSCARHKQVEIDKIDKSKTGCFVYTAMFEEKEKCKYKIEINK